MPECEDEAEHDRHHQRRVQVDLVALERDARDERHERGQREAVERRPIDGREVQSAQHDAEDADDEQRLVRRRCRIHRERRASPQRARERGSERPVASPASRRADPRLLARPCAGEEAAPRLVRDDQRHPGRHPPRRQLRPRGRGTAASRPAASRRTCDATRRRAAPPGRHGRAPRRRDERRGGCHRHRGAGRAVSCARPRGPRGCRAGQARRSPARASARSARAGSRSRAPSPSPPTA